MIVIVVINILFHVFLGMHKQHGDLSQNIVKVAQNGPNLTRY